MCSRIGVWVSSWYKDGSEAPGLPTAKGVGRGKPDESLVGGSARLSAPPASWVPLSVDSSIDEESGIIRGITDSAMVTVTSSVATIRAPRVTVVSSALLCVTMTSPPASVSSLLPVVTSGGGGVVGAGVVLAGWSGMVVK